MPEPPPNPARPARDPALGRRRQVAGLRTGSYASVGGLGRRAEPSGASAARRDGAAESTTGGRARELLRTGYFKPLGPTARAGRWVESLGLTLGQGLASVVRDDAVFILLMAVVVGVAGGAASGLLLLWIESANRSFASIAQLGLVGVPVLLAVPALGGLLVGLGQQLLRRLGKEPVAGIPAVIEAVAHRSGHLDGVGGVALGIGTGLTIGSGGSVGHEGPSVAIGATVGSVLGRFFGLRLRRRIAMVGAGCAAGLAAAFNAPLAGVVFTVEVVFRRSVGGNVGTMSMFAPLVVAAVAGTFTSHAIFGARTEFDAAIGGAESLRELPFYLGLALLAALGSFALDRAILLGLGWADRLQVPPWLKPALGGLGVGGLGVLIGTELMGSGRGLVGQALASELGWELAGWLVLAKLLATALTIASGGVGGIFMPSLFLGACCGILVHALAAAALGDAVATPGAYALIGMGAFLGASLRAPITPIVMLFELTRDYALVLPIMFAVIVSSLVASRLRAESLFDGLLTRRGIRVDDEADTEREVMKRGHVADLMVEPDHLLRVDGSFDEVRRAVLAEEAPTLYVVDARGVVVGWVDGVRLAARIVGGASFEGESVGSLMDPKLPALLEPEDTLAGAMLAMARSRRDVLPVVDRERRLLALLHRQDLAAHYSAQVLDREEATLELHGPGVRQEVALAPGMIVERVVVGRRWAGKTLQQLDLRQRAGVLALEWRRGEQLLAVEPQVPLREGDVLALVGRREGILAARQLE